MRLSLPLRMDPAASKKALLENALHSEACRPNYATDEIWRADPLRARAACFRRGRLRAGRTMVLQMDLSGRNPRRRYTAGIDERKSALRTWLYLLVEGSAAGADRAFLHIYLSSVLQISLSAGLVLFTVQSFQSDAHGAG